MYLSSLDHISPDVTYRDASQQCNSFLLSRLLPAAKPGMTPHGSQNAGDSERKASEHSWAIPLTLLNTLLDVMRTPTVAGHSNLAAATRSS